MYLQYLFLCATFSTALSATPGLSKLSTRLNKGKTLRTPSNTTEDRPTQFLIDLPLKSDQNTINTTTKRLTGGKIHRRLPRNLPEIESSDIAQSLPMREKRCKSQKRLLEARNFYPIDDLLHSENHFLQDSLNNIGLDPNDLESKIQPGYNFETYNKVKDALSDYLDKTKQSNIDAMSALKDKLQTYLSQHLVQADSSYSTSDINQSQQDQASKGYNNDIEGSLAHEISTFNPLRSYGGNYYNEDKYSTPSYNLNDIEPILGKLGSTTNKEQDGSTIIPDFESMYPRREMNIPINQHGEWLTTEEPEFDQEGIVTTYMPIEKELDNVRIKNNDLLEEEGMNFPSNEEFVDSFEESPKWSSLVRRENKRIYSGRPNDVENYELSELKDKETAGHRLNTPFAMATGGRKMKSSKYVVSKDEEDVQDGFNIDDRGSKPSKYFYDLENPQKTRYRHGQRNRYDYSNEEIENPSSVEFDTDFSNEEHSTNSKTWPRFPKPKTCGSERPSYSFKYRLPQKYFPDYDESTESVEDNYDETYEDYNHDNKYRDKNGLRSRRRHHVENGKERSPIRNHAKKERINEENRSDSIERVGKFLKDIPLVKDWMKKKYNILAKSRGMPTINSKHEEETDSKNQPLERNEAISWEKETGNIGAVKTETINNVLPFIGSRNENKGFKSDGRSPQKNITADSWYTNLPSNNDNKFSLKIPSTIPFENGILELITPQMLNSSIIENTNNLHAIGQVPQEEYSTCSCQHKHPAEEAPSTLCSNNMVASNRRNVENDLSKYQILNNFITWLRDNTKPEP